MHNLFGERFMGRREPAWHGLGIVFDEPLTVTQAMEVAGLDYRVVKAPLVTTAFGLPVALDKVAIVREPTHDDPEPRVLGIAGRDYETVDNTDVAAILDPLTTDWPVETVGALGQGERTFVTLEVGTSDVRGDPVTEYFLVTTGHTGGHSIRLAYTPVRVVCQNTLVLGLEEASVTSAISHSRGARATLEFRVGLMAKLRRAADSSLAAMRSLADVPVYAPELDQVLRAAYPTPRRSAKARLAETVVNSRALTATDLDEIYADLNGRDLVTAVEVDNYYRARVENLRAAATELFDRFNDEHPAVAHTGWAAYNAVTETECFRNGRAGVDQDVLFGSRAATMERAFRACLSLAGDN